MKKIGGQIKHGLTGTPTYRVWEGMKQRCLNKNAPAYDNYGGRGIQICDRWLTFINFLNDMGKRPEGMTLDRINNNSNYEPSNCRWATRKEQGNNRRNSKLFTIEDETKTLAEWCQQYNISRNTVDKRLQKGLDIKTALTLKRMSRGGRIGNLKIDIFELKTALISAIELIEDVAAESAHSRFYRGKADELKVVNDKIEF